MECPGANIPLPGYDSQIERTTHRRYRRAGERHTASAAAGLNSVRLVRARKVRNGAGNPPWNQTRLWLA